MAGLESLEQLMSKDTDAYLSAMSDDDDEACRTPGKKRQQLVKNLPDDQLALVNLLKHDLGGLAFLGSDPWLGYESERSSPNGTNED